MSSLQGEQTQQVSPRENQNKEIEESQGIVTSRATGTLCNEHAESQPGDFQPHLLLSLGPAILTVNTTRFRISMDVHLWVRLGGCFQRGLAEEGEYTLCGSALSRRLGSWTE